MNIINSIGTIGSTITNDSITKNSEDIVREDSIKYYNYIVQQNKSINITEDEVALNSVKVYNVLQNIPFNEFIKIKNDLKD